MTARKKLQLRFGILSAMIFVVAICRLIPHPPNFTPVGAMALFGAAYFTRRIWAFVVPLVAMWMSDLLVTNVLYAEYYEGFQWFGGFGYTYLAIAMTAAVGFFWLRRVTVLTGLSSGLMASLLFFVVTNFGVWAGSAMYPKSIAGLMACYTAGLPFLGNTLAGTLLFGAVMFGAYEWMIKPRLELARA